MDILKPDQSNARNRRLCTSNFLEVKLRQTLGKTESRYGICGIVIRSNVLFLTVLLNQPAGRHNRCAQYMHVHEICQLFPSKANT